MKTYAFYAFNTDCQVHIEDTHAESEIQALFTEIESWHHVFNVFDTDSEVSRFNQSKTLFQGSPLFYQVLQEMMKYRKKTDRYFEPFVEVLLAEFRVSGVISPHVETSYQQLHQNGDITFSKNNMIEKSDPMIQVNFHSFLKGYACDYMRQYMYETLNLRHFLIDFGGNILAEGMASEGAYWRVGIQHPNAMRGEVIQSLDLLNASLVTSGSYERPVMIGGRAYSHLMNPETGHFLPMQVYSVSVQTMLSVEAEVLSTAFFVCPREKRQELLQYFSAKVYVAENEAIELYS